MMNAPLGLTSWDEVYTTGNVDRLPWFFPSLDPDLEAALAKRGIAKGRLLDQGTGPGTQAIALAETGFDVVATDVSPAAIAYAAGKAKERGVTARFVMDDVLAPKIEGPFDVIFDRGCFHTLSPEVRAAYVGSMHGLLARGGYLFLKTFSHLQPGTQGPHRFSPDDIRKLFGDESKFEILEITDTVYQGQLDPWPKALLSTMRRR